MLVDVQFKIEGNKAYPLNKITVDSNNRKWIEIVSTMSKDVSYYTCRNKPVYRGNRKAVLVSSGTLTQAEIDSLLPGIVSFRKKTYNAKINTLRNSLGNDARDEIEKIDTHPWSQLELKRFLIIRFDITKDQFGKIHGDSYVYWKTEFGFTTQEISDIEDEYTVWNPKYTDEYGFYKFQNTYVDVGDV